MSDHENAASEHKTDLRIAALAFAFPPIFIACFAIAIVSYSGMFGSRNADTGEEAVAARILPVARVELAVAGPGGAKGAKSGEEVFNGACGACHTAGVAGAPKIGDKGAWAKRFGGGLAALLKTAIAGKGAMPARGGAADLSDYELSRAIVYMANQSGGKLKEPAAPKGAAPAAERSGQQVVQAACIRCHESGQGGAPRIGDKTAWSQRISQGVDAVTKSAIRGHGGMPARGGLADLTDREVTGAILYMFGRAGAGGAAATAKK